MCVVRKRGKGSDDRWQRDEHSTVKAAISINTRCSEGKLEGGN